MSERILKEKEYFVKELAKLLIDMEAHPEKYFDVVEEVPDLGQVWVELSDVRKALLRAFEEKKIWKAGLWVENKKIESVEQLDELQDKLLSKIAKAAWEVFGPYAATINIGRDLKDPNKIHLDLIGGFEATFWHLYEFSRRAGLEFWKGYHIRAEAWIDHEGVELVNIVIEVPGGIR